MGGCADREDKFKERKISDLSSLEEFERELARQASESKLKKSKGQKINEDQNLLIQSKVNLIKNKSVNDINLKGSKNKLSGKQEFNSRKSLHGRLSIDKQLESDSFLVSPIIKTHRISLDHCDSILIEKERISYSSNHKGDSLVNNLKDILVAGTNPESKKEKIFIDHCEGFSVKPRTHSMKNDKFKISPVISDSIIPKEPKSPYVEIIAGKRPESPEAESNKIFYEPSFFAKLKIKSLKKIAKIPELDKDLRVKRNFSIQTSTLGIVEKVKRTLSIQTNRMGIFSPPLRREIKVEKNQALKDKRNACVKLWTNPFESDHSLELSSPLSPIYSIDFSNVDEISTSSSLQRRNTYNPVDYNKTSYCKIVDSRDFTRKSISEFKNNESIPEEPQKRSKLKKLSLKIADLNLKKIKERSSNGSLKVLRRVQTLNEINN